MNMKKIVVCGLLAVPMLAEAMPSKADLDAVSPVVADLMKPEQDALKAGKKTKSEVADAALELVKQADGEAAKLLLAKGAFNLYVRDGQFDKALDTLKIMRTEVSDLTLQYLANIIETSLKRVPKKNGGQLYQLLDETKTLARYQDELKKLEAQAKKRPADKALQTKLAEHYAVLGDWTKALEHFAKGEDAKVAQMAKDEQDGAKDAKAIADYWWGYPDKKGEEFEKSFKQHAAALYSQAVASGKLVGLNKVQSERRIEEAKAFGEAVYEAQDIVCEDLVNRWMFDTDFVDCIGKVEAKKIRDAARIEDGQCIIDGAGLDLGDALKSVGIPFTLEMWYTETKRVFASRIVKLGFKKDVEWATGDGREGFVNFCGATPSRGLPEMQFTLGHKYYLSFTYDGKTMTAYKYDLNGDKKLLSYSAEMDVLPFRPLWVGVPCSYPNDRTRHHENAFACAKYDEIRIWSVCKSRSDIDATVKAGPERIVKPKAPCVPSKK